MLKKKYPKEIGLFVRTALSEKAVEYRFNWKLQNRLGHDYQMYVYEFEEIFSIEVRMWKGYEVLKKEKFKFQSEKECFKHLEKLVLEIEKKEKVRLLLKG